MLACRNCFSSPALQEAIATQGREATCGLCGVNERCLSSEALAPAFSKLIGYYPYGSLAAVLSDSQATNSLPAADPSLPVITLAQRIREDGLLVFAPSLTDNLCNEWLDAVRTQEDRMHRPATGSWHSSGLGIAGKVWWQGVPPEDWTGWLAFSRFVKHRSRFVIDFQSGGIPDYPALLQTSNPALCHSVKTETVFHRARLHDSAIGPDTPSDDEMGAPPSEKARAGRANASGIRVLYVADSPATAIYEMRPSRGAVVHLARCQAKTNLKVFDFTAHQRVRGLDPFSRGFESLAKTMSTLAILDDEFAAPVARHTPDRDYAPTQYIAELIHSRHYDGIRYRSAMAPEGVNYAFFEPEEFDVRYDRSVKISGVRVEWSDHCSGLSALIGQPDYGAASVG